MTKYSHNYPAYSTANYIITSHNLSENIFRLRRDFPKFDRRDRRNIITMSRYLDAFTYRGITFYFTGKLRRVK